MVDDLEKLLNDTEEELKMLKKSIMEKVVTYNSLEAVLAIVEGRQPVLIECAECKEIAAAQSD
jgi:hypothetical protein